jgi:hypothetical protein
LNIHFGYELNKLKRNIVMDFNLTEEQLMIQKPLEILLKVNCCPAIERDEFSKFPRAGQKMAELGFI